MKKLAIFGDSFCDPYTHGHWEYPELDNKGWPLLLKSHYDVTIFAKTASSIYYNYNNFLKNHESFDQIVFGLTEPTRWIAGFNINGVEKHFKSYDQVVGHIQNTKFFSAPLYALRDYYRYLMDIEACDRFAKLMIDDIRRVRTDAIIVLFDGEPSFGSYLRLQSQSFGKNGNIIRYKEKRCVCHYTEEINEVVYKNILNALQTNSWDPTIPKTVTVKEELGYYFDLNT